MPVAPNLVSQAWTAELEPPESIPQQADVVIIGGGIVGACTAWFLAQQGVDVVVCEKGHIGGEQSSRNWGWVRTMMRDTRELPMMIESMQIWRQFEAQTGEDVGFRQNGCLLLSRSRKNLNELAKWLPIAKEYELDTRIVERDGLDALLQNGSSQWVGGAYTPSDACAEPHKATRAIARAAVREGATFVASCAVRGIETMGGAVSGVVTEHGLIKADTVLCAAGAWSSMFCRSLGIDLPQLKVQGTVARMAPGPDVLQTNAYDEELGIRMRQDGGYTVAHGFMLHHSITPATIRYSLKFLPALMVEFGKMRVGIGREFFNELRTPTRWPLDAVSPFEKCRILNPAPDPRVVRKTRSAVTRLFPELASTEFVETWSGMVETTPDVIPVMGSVASIRGFYIATGFSGHGFGIGPGAGKAAAAMLTGNDGIDLSEFRIERFTDGSPMRPQSSV